MRSKEQSDQSDPLQPGINTLRSRIKKEADTFNRYVADGAMQNARGKMLEVRRLQALVDEVEGSRLKKPGNNKVVFPADTTPRRRYTNKKGTNEKSEINWLKRKKIWPL